jgi:hypothetical protein
MPLPQLGVGVHVTGADALGERIVAGLGTVVHGFSPLTEVTARNAVT